MDKTTIKTIGNIMDASAKMQKAMPYEIRIAGSDLENVILLLYVQKQMETAITRGINMYGCEGSITMEMVDVMMQKITFQIM